MRLNKPGARGGFVIAVARAFGQHKPAEGDIWPRCGVEKRAAELMLSFVVAQQACQTEHVISQPDTYTDDLSFHSVSASISGSEVRSAAIAASSFWPLCNSHEAVHMHLQEDAAQQHHRNHWPTPTSAAWELTQKLVAQVAAVLEWLQTPAQRESLAEVLAENEHSTDVWDHEEVSDYIQLQNLLSQILCALLLGHILDLALDMTEPFQTAFGITMQGWAACSPECFDELPENAATLIAQHGISIVLNGLHARQLGQAMLQRLAVDDQLAQKVALAFAQPSAGNPLHRSSSMVVKSIFQMLRKPRAIHIGSQSFAVAVGYFAHNTASCSPVGIAEIVGKGQHTGLANNVASDCKVLKFAVVYVEDAQDVRTALLFSQNRRLSVAVMAWHPDWKLLVNAAHKLIQQPDFACNQVQAVLYDLVNLLQPNPCLQLTAAAVVCALKHSIMQQRKSRDGQKPHSNPVLKHDDLDSVPSALCWGFLVRTRNLAELDSHPDNVLPGEQMHKTNCEKLCSAC